MYNISMYLYTHTHPATEGCKTYDQNRLSRCNLESGSFTTFDGKSGLTDISPRTSFSFAAFSEANSCGAHAAAAVVARMQRVSIPKGSQYNVMRTLGFYKELYSWFGLDAPCLSTFSPLGIDFDSQFRNSEV